MVLTKSYLRYVPAQTVGIISSQKCNGLFCKFTHDPTGQAKRGFNSKRLVAITGALENIILWECKSGEKVATLAGGKHEVTKLALSQDQKLLAAGYADGSIKLWDLVTLSCRVTLSGHKSAVTALRFNGPGTVLASGSQDTDVIVWDVVDESGLYRLKGHKGPVTDVLFFPEKNVLISSSNDTFVKLWDLTTKHCFQTLIGHRGEVTALALVGDSLRLVTGSADQELRIWAVNDTTVESSEVSTAASSTTSTAEKPEAGYKYQVHCELLGTIQRQSKERVLMLALNENGTLLGCLGADSFFEIFKVRTEEEVEAHVKRRVKRARKALREKEEKGKAVDPQPKEIERCVDDEMSPVYVQHADTKIRSIDFTQLASGSQRVLCSRNDNSVAVYELDFSEKPLSSQLVSSVVSAGHRSAVKAIDFNSDGSAYLTVSPESIKVWNIGSQQCIRTLECDYAQACFFMPGDTHVVVGCKNGFIKMFNLASGTTLESEEAHSAAVSSLCLAPDKRGFVSGSADNTVKFWEFELVQDGESSKKRLSFAHVRTLEMSDNILCVKFSPDQRLIAIALLDFTVKVFFADSLKYFLSLYGHKLPVITMDISFDSTLLVTGSADKNCKLWGLDFGDCHKSLFAHDDSITAVKFVPKTHYFFTASKDKTIKFWDGDKFKHISTLEGHHSEVWCLTVNPRGTLLVSASLDRSLRVWQRTNEPVHPEDEREQEREAADEEAMAGQVTKVIPGETEGEAELAGRQTIDTIKGAERLIEAIEIAQAERAKLDAWAAQKEKSSTDIARPEPHPMIIAYGLVTPERFVLDVFRKVRSSEAEEALLLLPFSYVVRFLKLLDFWLKSAWEIELSCRSVFFLLRIHHNQIISTEALLPVVDSLKTNTRSRLQQLRDSIGFNLAGLNVVQRELESRSIYLFADAEEKRETSRKRRRAAVRTLS
ncbi:WD repeat-containing protein 3-like [Sycon ciliatum]|uniref:WD repeat-containing protein 3-like n=1 Tax=Sycon ciliatum TaxID=27933 RepID=UPI0020ACE203|eukprot:scpid34868/ scgid12158/ WD repeat-containing protein 3